MELYPDRCPHKSIPVETDESMTSSSLNLVLPACHLCLEPGETKRHHWFTPEVTINDVSRMNYPEDYWSRNPAEQRGKTPVCHATSASGPPHRQLHVDPPSSLNQRLDPFLMEPPQILQRERDRRKEFSASPSRFCRDLYEPPSQTWNSPSEEEESLEPPLPLCSDPGDSPYQNALQYRPSYYGLQVNPQHHNFEASKCAKEFPCRQLPNLICQKNQQPQLEPRNCPQSWYGTHNFLSSFNEE
ncbi:uncharacterized protein LOC115810194 [Chanos chanos]|uniref:Uncharacterized protein LOC115810194 n=1 Tax=Chanos chanos TaxID=29144 RepID=A0A6J2V9W0_CHACN|nr:uncharacterized protein LOC115810194 [Chanos chanos]